MLDDQEPIGRLSHVAHVFGSDDDQDRRSSGADLVVAAIKSVTSSAVTGSNNHSPAQQKQRKKRRKRKDEQEAEEHNKLNSGTFSTEAGSNELDVWQLPSTSTHIDDCVDHARPQKVSKGRQKRKNKKAHADDGFPVDSIQADILHLKQNFVISSAAESDSPYKADDRRQVWHTTVQSQPVGKIFVEREKGFKALEEWKLTQKLASSLVRMQSGSRMTMSKSGSAALELGLSLHCYTKRLANYCHGILAGFALWQCVMVYRLTSPSFSTLDFVEHYSFMASLAQALFYVLTTICLVSVMGRCDIGNYSGQWLRQVRKFTAGLVALLAYFVTLLLSLLVADLDEKLALHAHNSTDDMRDSEIQAWKNLNLGRCLGAMTAWLALAVSPDRDLLYDSVRALADANDETQ